MNRPIKLAFLALVILSMLTLPLLAPKGEAQAQVITFILSTSTRTPTPINVGNFVWEDSDRDGIQDAGEPGLPGVTVQLWNESKTNLIDSDVTDSNGNYRLIAPSPGNYRVRAILPGAGDYFTVKNAGGDDLRDSDINPSGLNAGFTDTYTFASNLISITSIDIGIVKFYTPTPTRTPTPVSVGNFVWHDLNRNGIQDSGEPGVGGVMVQLWNSSKTLLIGTTTTDGNGFYRLVAPGPGNYRVRVIPPAGASFSPIGQGIDDLRDSDINPGGLNLGFTNTYTFASNLISITSIDAGLMNVVATATPNATELAAASATPTATSSGAPSPGGVTQIIFLPMTTK